MPDERKKALSKEAAVEEIMEMIHKTGLPSLESNGDSLRRALSLAFSHGVLWGQHMALQALEDIR